MYNPQLTVDPVGNATAVWRRSDASRSVVQAATRPAGGTWTTPVDLSVDPSPADDKDELPHVAVDAAGNATAIWSRYTDKKTTIQAATRPAGGNWTAPVGLSVPDQNARAAQVCVDSAGNATAIWQRQDGAGSWVVTTATRPTGGTWGAPVDLSDPSLRIDNPQLAVAPAGDVTAAWGHFNGANYVVRAATRPIGGTWSTSVDLSATGQDALGGAEISIDAHGDSTAIWTRHDGKNFIATTATRTAGGTWQAPVDVSDPGQDALVPEIAVNATGNATATWLRAKGTDRVVQAATRPAGGAWSTPITISSPGGYSADPQIALDPTGNAITTWSRFDGTNRIVQARGLDAAGPVVTALVAPPTGGTGQTVNYSVTAHDVWSTVSSVLWDFGDGTTATGPSVTHKRAQHGTRPVKVTLTDAVGNTTTCTTLATCTSSNRTAPVITKAKVKPAKIRATGSRARAKKAATVVLGLTTDAKVTFVFKRAGGGKVIQLTKKLKAGTNTFKIRAALARRKILRPRRYAITVTAKNQDGRSPARTLKLRVVR